MFGMSHLLLVFDEAATSKLMLILLATSIELKAPVSHFDKSVTLKKVVFFCWKFMGDDQIVKIYERWLLMTALVFRRKVEKRRSDSVCSMCLVVSDMSAIVQFLYKTYRYPKARKVQY